MVDCLNLIAVLIGLIIVILCIKCIFRNSECISTYIYIIFFFIFVLPLSFDIISGHPADYLIFTNITKAVQDKATNIIYAVFIIYFSIIFGLFIRKDLKRNIQKTNSNNVDILESLYKRWKFILFLIIISPIILFLFVPDKEKFMVYTYLEMRDFNEDSLDIIGTLYIAINLSTIAVFISIFFKNKGLKSIIPYIPILFINIWLNGKRNIVALVVVFIIYMIISNRNLKSTIKIFNIGLIFIGVILYSSFYKTIKENLREEGADRIEYYRDHTVKLSIYSELYPEKTKILDYRGQSLIFYATIYIPRNVWEKKPMPYAQYITSAALNASPQFWGWGITNSIFDELICNFGLWIILLFPFLIIQIIKFGESANNRFASILTILIISLLFSVEITAYFPIYILYIIFVIYTKKKNKSRLRKKIIPIVEN